MTKRTITRLSDFMNPDEYSKELTKALDILDVPLQFESVRFMSGQKSSYCLITAHRLDNGEEITVSTGAKMVMDTMQVADRRHMFPFQAVMYREPGKDMIKLADVTSE